MSSSEEISPEPSISNSDVLISSHSPSVVSHLSGISLTHSKDMGASGNHQDPCANLPPGQERLAKFSLVSGLQAGEDNLLKLRQKKLKLSMQWIVQTLHAAKLGEVRNFKFDSRKWLVS